MRGTAVAIVAIVVAVLLGGCADESGTGEHHTGAAAESGSLPVPATGRGGVTGMPDSPGPGQIGPPDPLPPELPEDTMVDRDGHLVLAPDAGVARETGIDGPLPDAAPPYPRAREPQAFIAEPGPQDAVAVMRDYYAALNAGSPARAYRLWSDGGRASGQSPQQFADGFAHTAGVSVEIMTPGRVDAAAGLRYIEVPVTVTHTQRDGSLRRYAGAYTLRRSVADGAGAERRGWRISSADLREVQL